VVEHGGEMRVALEQERRPEQPELLAELAGVAERREGQVERTEPESLDLLRGVAQLGGGKDADLHRTVGGCGHSRGEAVSGHVVRMTISLVVREPKLEPGTILSAGCRHEGDSA
jgi:hypothetical protein